MSHQWLLTSPSCRLTLETFDPCCSVPDPLSLPAPCLLLPHLAVGLLDPKAIVDVFWPRLAAQAVGAVMVVVVRIAVAGTVVNPAPLLTLPPQLFL